MYDTLISNFLSHSAFRFILLHFTQESLASKLHLPQATTESTFMSSK